MEENKNLVLSTEPAENAGNNASSAEPKKKKLPLTHSLPAKVTAFIITVISTVIALATIAMGCMFLSSNHQVYNVPKEEMKREILENEALDNAMNVVSVLYENDLYANESAKAMIDLKNISSMNIEFSEDVPNKNWSYNSGKEPGDYSFTFMLYNFGAGYVVRDSSVAIGARSTARVTVVLTKTFTASDRFSMQSAMINFIYSMRYMTYVIAFISTIITIAGFVFLMCSSGRHQTSDEPEASFATRVPFDVLVLGAGLVCMLFGAIIIEVRNRDIVEMIFACFLMVFALATGLGLCMSLATRIKLGGWWKNTVIYKILRAIGRFFKLCIKLLTKIPLVWRTVLTISGIWLFELIVIGLGDARSNIAYMFLRGFIMLPIAVYVSFMLRKLLIGSKSLADGQLDKQVNTRGMVLDLKQAGNNLNSIGKGMSLAVEERTKSDRMKTELITNVSHDIKTPLTSIINYSDLISKEPAGSGKITEYSEVLHRQSEKLKRLIDDLVETSKATTGNLEVVLAPCSVNELLSQAEGEYEQKMENAGLTLVSSIPEKNISIMADGRRLWRVFDNLLNNACKYALSGTRVYMSLEEQDKDAVITFKNTSRDALNISSDELMERFVRGDKSRNSSTEGNGLGLAIARSLTELQQGKLELFIDGDLFKAELRFPLI